jgi:hypothetical protein
VSGSTGHCRAEMTDAALEAALFASVGKKNITAYVA